MKIEKANEVFDQKAFLTGNLCQSDLSYLESLGLNCENEIFGSAKYGLLNLYISMFLEYKGRVSQTKDNYLLNLLNEHEIKTIRMAFFEISSQSIKEQFKKFDEEFDAFMETKKLTFTITLGVSMTLIVFFFLVMLKPLEYSLRKRVFY